MVKFRVAKKKFIILSGVIIFLFVGALVGLYYSKNMSMRTFSSLTKELKQKGYSVKDITSKFNKDFPNNSDGIQKAITVNNINIYVIICKQEDKNRIIQKQLATIANPLIDFSSPPHLYSKDNLIVITCFGEDKELQSCLEEFLGKQLNN